MRRSARPIYFVCSGICNEKLVSKCVPAKSKEEAITFFSDNFLFLPQEVFGPFYKKRVIPVKQFTFQFSEQPSKRAIYNDWIVNALFLQEPKDHAYLLFIQRVDGKKMTSPKGITIVPLDKIRII